MKGNFIDAHFSSQMEGRVELTWGVITEPCLWNSWNTSPPPSCNNGITGAKEGWRERGGGIRAQRGGSGLGEGDWGSKRGDQGSERGIRARRGGLGLRGGGTGLGEGGLELGEGGIRAQRGRIRAQRWGSGLRDGDWGSGMVI